MTNAANDSTMLEAMTSATKKNLKLTRSAPTKTFVADTGYWRADVVGAETEAELLITPMPVTRGTSDPTDQRIEQRNEVVGKVLDGKMTIADAAAAMGVSSTWIRDLLERHEKGKADPAVLRKEMLARLGTERGRATYAKRKILAEPVFGNIKANLRFRRFSRRGMDAALSEWRLICAVHNLLKVRNHRLAVA